MSKPSATAAYLSPSALTALNIKQQPFAVASQDKLYSDPELNAQLEMLRHNLHYSQLTQVFWGEKGSGKTSLVLRLLYSIADDIEVFVSNADAQLTTDKIIQELLQALEIKATDSPAKSVLRALQSKTYPDQVAALIIDDAHLLQLDELEKLLALIRSFNQELDGRLRLLLIAEPQFKSTLDAFAKGILPTQEVFTCAIKPFDKQQTQNYLKYRFELLGVDQPFGQQHLTEIHETSMGLPAQINAQACELLNESYSNQPTTTRTAPRWRLPALMASFIFIALPLLVLMLAKPEPETHPLEQLPATANNSALVYKDQLNEQAITLNSTANDSSQTTPDNTDAENLAALPAAEPTPEQLPGKPALVVKPQPETKPPVLNVKSTLKTADWLLEQTTGQYVIQILALENSVAFHTFVQQAPSSANIAVFTTRYQGRDWYVAVYGLYPSANDARAAIRKLPASLRRNQPWVRSITSVQQAISQQTP